MNSELSSAQKIDEIENVNDDRDPQMEDAYFIRSGWTDITPTASLPLAGFCNRTSNYENINSPLEADIIILQDSRQRIVLLSLDVLYVGRALKEAILSRSGGTIKENELFIWASHNHFAPSTDPDKPMIGVCDAQYIEYVAERIAKLIETLLRTAPKKVQLSYGASRNKNLVVNRRRKGLILEKRSSLYVPHLGTKILPNKKQYRDGKISTILLQDQEGGQPIALIWNFACHPVSSPGNNTVRAEYPGEIRKMLRTQFQSEIPVVFLQGFSGDIRPPSLAKFPRKGGYKKKIHHVALKTIYGNYFDSFDETDWSNHLLSLWDVMKNASRIDDREKLGTGLNTKTTELNLKDLGIAKDKKLKICSIRIGKLRIIGFSAEVVAEWERIVNNVFPNDILIFAGCFDDVFGYLPTEEMILDGGYEVEGFMQTFNISGKYEFGLEGQIITALNKLK